MMTESTILYNTTERFNTEIWTCACVRACVRVWRDWKRLRKV